MHALSQILAPGTLEKQTSYQQSFAKRDIFRHVVMDDFFGAQFLAQLLQEFPDFSVGNDINEQGEAAGKATVEKVRKLGPSFAALDDLIKSPAFLGWLSDLSGIPDLLYDRFYYGGGTHENRQGQELDTHVDFNRHPHTGWHRRLNLIVYLNEQWQSDWGGCLELRKDPLVRQSEDSMIAVSPALNRGVMFETTRWSWHGFPAINLPKDKRDLGRKSIALYFYSKSRPQEEMSTTHSTIYVDRELPKRFQAGLTLSESDVDELEVLIERRDGHIRRLYKDKDQMRRRLEMVLNSRMIQWYRSLRRFVRWPR